MTPLTDERLAEITRRWENRNKVGEGYRDFYAYASEDMGELLAEVKRLRGIEARQNVEYAVYRANMKQEGKQ